MARNARLSPVRLPPVRLPKRIAGIKLPRPLRKAINPWLAELDQAQLRALVGTALSAAVVAIIEREFADADTGKLRRRLEHLAESTGRDGLAGTLAHALAAALGRREPAAPASPTAPPTAH